MRFALILIALLVPAPLVAETPPWGTTLSPPQGPAVNGFTHSFRSAFGVSYSDGATPTAQPGIAGIYTLGYSHTTDGGIGFDFRLQLRAGNFHLHDAPAHGEIRN